MKMKEIPYFTRSVDRAEKRFADYKARTEAQARNLGFVCAGNLGKGSRNRLNTITDKSVRLYSAYTLRRLFLKMYRLEDNGTRIFWAELNDILRICQTEASPFHNYDYSSFAWDDSDLEDKYNLLVFNNTKVIAITVAERVRGFDLASSTPMECMLFISDLKKSLSTLDDRGSIR